MEKMAQSKKHCQNLFSHLSFVSHILHAVLDPIPIIRQHIIILQNYILRRLKSKKSYKCVDTVILRREENKIPEQAVTAIDFSYLI